MRSFSLVLAFGLAACSGAKDAPADDSAGGEDSDTSGDTDEGGSEDAPSVIEVRMADCTTNGDSVDIWTVTLGVSDPQDDVARVGSTITVLDGDEELAVYGLACSSDTCSGSWRNTDDDITCDVGYASTFRVVLVDDFGNTSAPYDFQPS